MHSTCNSRISASIDLVKFYISFSQICRFYPIAANYSPLVYGPSCSRLEYSLNISSNSYRLISGSLFIYFCCFSTEVFLVYYLLFLRSALEIFFATLVYNVSDQAYFQMGWSVFMVFLTQTSLLNRPGITKCLLKYIFEFSNIPKCEARLYHPLFSSLSLASEISLMGFSRNLAYRTIFFKDPKLYALKRVSSCIYQAWCWTTICSNRLCGS